MTDLAGLPSALLGGLGQTGADAGQTAAGLGRTVADAGGAATSVGLAAPMEHVVQPGETLGGIAADHGVSVGAMMSANPQVLHPDMIEAGAYLAVPASTPQPAASDSLSTPADAPPDGGTPAPAAPTSRAAGDGVEAQTSLAADPAAETSVPRETTPTVSAAADLAGAPIPVAGEIGPDALSGGPLAAGLVLSTLSRAGLDWRLVQQQGGLALSAATVAGPTGSIASAGSETGVLLQALAGDPMATAALARILGDSKAAVLAVLTARLAMAPALDAPASSVSIQERAAAEGAASQLPAGVDLAGRRTLPEAGRRIAAAAGRAPAETLQGAWVRRCAPAAMAVKGRWGVPAGFTIAHGALTSDWGRLAPGNDYFGLLPLPAPGASRALVALSGPAPTAFDSLDAAAAAFGSRLRGDVRYAAAFRTPHPAAFAARLAADGLVHDPLYAPAMEAVIEAHALARYD